MFGRLANGQVGQLHMKWVCTGEVTCIKVTFIYYFSLKSLLDPVFLQKLSTGWLI